MAVKARSGRTATTMLAVLLALSAPAGPAVGAATAMQPGGGSGQSTGKAAPATAVANLVLERPHPLSVFEDRQASIDGSLGVVSDEDVVNEHIVLDRRAEGRRWLPWLTTSTDEAGGFSFPLGLRRPQTLELRARHVGVGGATLKTSGIQQLTVLNRSVALQTRQHYVTFGDVALAGKTRPAVANARIVIQRLVNGRWRQLGSTTTRADGSYGYRMPHREPGRWRVRALWNGTSAEQGTRETSAVRRYDVRAVLAPKVEPVNTDELGATWHEGCPVGASSLRNVRLTFRTNQGLVKRGLLVVRSSIVPEVIDVWRAALRAGFPFHTLLSVDEFGGSDPRSMWHDNTSAFNCRAVTGDPFSLSPHSYGTAIDVNPVRNPYLDSSGRWWPHKKGVSYRNRADARPGMLYGASKVTSRLRHFGFQWGGYWSHPDYQHFDPRYGKSRLPAADLLNAAKAPPVAQPHKGPAALESGPLSPANLPDPASLGRGWQRYVEAGGEEEGWLGNGTYARARDPHEAANGVLPLGCASRPELTLPVATHALQGSYRSVTGSAASVVVLQFDSPKQARRYFEGLRNLLAACGQADGPAGVAVDLTARGADFTTAVRRYGHAGSWEEVDALVGDRVSIVLTSRLHSDQRAALRGMRAALAPR